MTDAHPPPPLPRVNEPAARLAYLDTLESRGITGTERADLLMGHILRWPDEDGWRLLYADHCELVGERERGEFIRVQCELATTPKINRTALGAVAIECQHGYSVCPICDAPPRLQLLRRREQELLPLGLGSGQGWFNVAWRWTYQNDGTNQQEWPFLWIAPEDVISFGRIYGRPARGFVDAVRCTMEQWYGTECETCFIGRGLPDSAYANFYICEKCDSLSRYDSSEARSCKSCGSDFVRKARVRDMPCPTCHGSGRLNALGVIIVLAAPIVMLELTQRSDGDMTNEEALNWARNKAGLPLLSLV